MPTKKSALGKGLGALIKAPPPIRTATSTSSPAPSAPGQVLPAGPLPPPVTSPPPLAAPAHVEEETSEPGDHVRQIKLAEIIPSPFQPRKRFSDGAITELMDSIREHGVIQPLIVRESGGKYELIAGERRFRACVLLNLSVAPTIVRKATDREVLEMALIENLQREDLNPVEEAEAYVRLAKEFHLRQEDIAQKVGRSRASVANAMRLLDLEESVRSLVSHGSLTSGHAKAILGLKTDEEQKLIAENVVRRNLNVRDTEKLVSQHISQLRGTATPATGAKTRRGDLPDYLQTIQNLLCSHLSTKVSIRQNGTNGKIEIEYIGDEQLDRILEIIGLDFGDGIDAGADADADTSAG